MECLPLASLHAAARAKQPAVQLKLIEDTRTKSVAKSRAKFRNQFGPAILHIEAASLETLEDGEIAVEAALDAMNQLHSTDLVKQRLVLVDSALGSSLQANKQLLTVVGQAQKEAPNKMPLVVDLLKHYYSVLLVLVDEIGNQRVSVALAREEIAAYNAEILRHSKCGVLCAPVDGVPAAITVSSPVMRKGQLKEDEPICSSSTLTTSNVSGKTGAAKAAFAAAVSSLSNQTSAVTNLTTQIAESTTRNATQLAKRTAQSVVRAGSAGTGPGRGTYAGIKGSKQVGLMYDESNKIDGSHFSRDESTLYKAQSELILQRQQSADLKAAKEVEASVQQLSQMNALVSERVFAQSEQLNLVEKNTDDAKLSVQLAAKELMKPLSATWNSKRMQIAFVWANLLFLLFLHWLIR